MNAPVLPWRLVLDTNVVLALWHFHDPALLPLANVLTQPATRLFAREDALQELADVLTRAHFGLAADAQTALLARYRARCEILPARAPNAPPLPRVRDADDQKFLEIARDARATHLVSRDRAVLAAGRQRAAKTLFLTLSPERLCATLPEAGTMSVFNQWPFGREQTS
ncbi:MAG: PIN domain-containing protein [Rhodocyclaceae bacterium]|nr:PIN domain-containing protein [Rhodocyclaceae bacterium]